MTDPKLMNLFEALYRHPLRRPVINFILAAMLALLGAVSQSPWAIASIFFVSGWFACAGLSLIVTPYRLEDLTEAQRKHTEEQCRGIFRTMFEAEQRQRAQQQPPASMPLLPREKLH